MLTDTDNKRPCQPIVADVDVFVGQMRHPFPTEDERFAFLQHDIHILCKKIKNKKKILILMFQ